MNRGACTLSGALFDDEMVCKVIQIVLFTPYMHHDLTQYVKGNPYMLNTRGSRQVHGRKSVSFQSAVKVAGESRIYTW